MTTTNRYVRSVPSLHRPYESIVTPAFVHVRAEDTGKRNDSAE